MAATLSLALGAPAGDPPAALAIPTLIDGLLQRTRANRAKRQALLDAKMTVGSWASRYLGTPRWGASFRYKNS